MLSKRGYLGRLPKVRTGRKLDHGWTSHFEDEIGFFQEVFTENPSPSCQSYVEFN